jgi:tetratricopeptide (TPR) repeat protein
MWQKAVTTGLSIVVTGVALVVTALIVYLLSMLWYRLRYRRQIPIALHASPYPAGAENKDPAAADPDVKSLISELTEFISADPPGPVAPGALESAGPPLSAIAFDNNSRWLAAMVSMVLARRPGYHVHLTPYRRAGNMPLRSVTATVVDRARGEVVAARTFDAYDAGLTAKIGSFCIFQVRAERRVARWIPRWERWRSETSYLAYREGQLLYAHGVAMLEEAAERTADGDAATAEKRNDSAIQALEAAAEKYRTACVADLGNLQPRLARAAILELLGDRVEATNLYRGCRNLWPENIEISYRLVVADQAEQFASRSPGHSPRSAPATGERARLSLPQSAEGSGARPTPTGDGARGARAGVEGIRHSLRRIDIVRNWLRTWHPKRYNPGERGYWLSWFLPWNPRAPLTSLRTKRTEFLAAIEVAEQVFQLRTLLDGDSAGDPPSPRKLFDGVAQRVIGRDTYGAMWLLHPEQMGKDGPTNGDKHKSAWHEVDGYDARPKPAQGPKARIGWLAHYNAACFLSLASRLTDEHRPWEGVSEVDWRSDCFRAALHELGRVIRDPYNALEPGWLDKDLDLEPMRKALEWETGAGPLAAFFTYSGRKLRRRVFAESPAQPHGRTVLPIVPGRPYRG